MHRFSLVALLVCACGGQIEPVVAVADSGAPDVVAVTIDAGPTCGFGQVVCGGACVYPNADHCGPQCEVCTTQVPNAHPTCWDDHCGTACDGIVCNGACVALDDASNCGACGRSCGAQPCLQGACVPELVESGAVMSFAVNDTSFYYGLTDAKLYVAAKGGGAPSVVSSGGDSVALDSTNVYWMDSFALRSEPLSGGTVSTLGTALLGGVVVDSGFAYGGGAAKMWEVPTTGGAVVAFDATIHFAGFALDATDIYCGGEGIVRISRATHAATTLLGSTVSVEGIGVDAQSIFFTTQTDIQSMPKSLASPPTTLASAQGVSAMTLGDDAVYYVSNGAVLRVAKTGGDPVTLARDTVARPELALDAQYVYFADLKGIVRTPR